MSKTVRKNGQVIYDVFRCLMAELEDREGNRFVLTRQIVDRAGVSRPTVIKYMSMLEDGHVVSRMKFGGMFVWKWQGDLS